MSSMVLSPSRSQFGARRIHRQSKYQLDLTSSKQSTVSGSLGDLDGYSKRRTVQPVQQWDAQSRRLARQHQRSALNIPAASGDSSRPHVSVLPNSALSNTVQLMLKLFLVLLVSIGFLYCASAILAASSSVVVKSLALAAWSCGFVPASYYLWNS